MSVHSVRLPDALWHRLNSALATANAERRRPIALSTLLRALLERGLDDPAGLPDLGSKVLRPDRLLAQTAATEASADRLLQAAEHTKTHKSFHDELKEYMKQNAVTPNKILSEAVLPLEDNTTRVSDLRRHTMQFIHSGFFPENFDGAFILDRIKHWLESKGA